MGHMLVNEFCWIEFGEVERENLTEKEKYQQLVSWAGKAKIYLNMRHKPKCF